MVDAARSLTEDEVLAIRAWPQRLGPYEAFGQRYEIWTDDAVLAGFLHELYDAMTVAEHREHGAPTGHIYRVLGPTDERRGVVMRDDSIIGSSEQSARIIESLQWAINRQVIIGACADRLILHAGGVVRDGAAIVLPAVMESGKTTLTTGLLDRGCGYLSDEAIAVDHDLTVEGYPKPLSIDPGSWDLFRHHEPMVAPPLQGYLEQQWQVAVPPIAPVVRTSRLGALVFPTYEAGAATSLEAMSPATVVRQGAHCTFVPPSSTIPTARLRDIAAIAAAVPVYRLISGDLQEACDAVLSVFDQVAGP